MNISEFFPFWKQLTSAQKQTIQNAAKQEKIKKGTIVHDGSNDCLGLILIQSGQLRAYIESDEGREITIYRLIEQDVCLLAASCMMKNIQFNMIIEAEKDTIVWIIPPDIYKNLMEQSAQIANYTNDIMSNRFSEVMWLVEQILWKSFDQRLAEFLLQEANLSETQILKITHEKIANHLGTAREVVTRMLRYFQNENIVHLSRGTIEIIDEKKLEQLAE